MTSQPNEQGTGNNPVIPPIFLLIISFAGFALALIIALTQPSFNTVGWGGLGMGVLGLMAWFLLAPEQLMMILRGRAFTFGGTALLVTLVFMVALVLVYIVVRQQGWRADFSQSENFSLSEQGRELVRTIAADPTVPALRILGFYGSAQAGQRDRTAVLLDDFVSASEGKISYEFIDPDRNPQLIDLYDVIPGQFMVALLNAEGQPDLENAEIVAFPDQTLLTDALITVSASGDFRAYFLSTDNAVSPTDAGPIGAGVLAEQIRTVFKWTVAPISLFDLANPQSGIDLRDPAADGIVLVIPGGSSALPDEQFQLITDFIDAGGSVVIFADLGLDGAPGLAASENFNTYLEDRFGLRISNDTVIDPLNSLQSPLVLLTSDFGDQFITENYAETDGIIMEIPQSIRINAEVPSTVVVTPLLFTSDQAYARSGLNFSQQLNEGDLARRPDDEAGPFILAAAAEDVGTGARVVVFGSTSLLYNQYQQFQSVGVRNLLAARDSFFWAADYENFFQRVPNPTSTDSPQNQPLFATDQQLRILNIISVGVLPFGILAIGIYIGWRRREREAA